jgi:hypothetical protein
MHFAVGLALGALIMSRLLRPFGRAVLALALLVPNALAAQTTQPVPVPAPRSGETRCIKDSFGNFTCTDGSRVLKDSFGNYTIIQPRPQPQKSVR